MHNILQKSDTFAVSLKKKKKKREGTTFSNLHQPDTYSKLLDCRRFREIKSSKSLRRNALWLAKVYAIFETEHSLWYSVDERNFYVNSNSLISLIKHSRSTYYALRNKSKKRRKKRKKVKGRNSLPDPIRAWKRSKRFQAARYINHPLFASVCARSIVEKEEAHGGNSARVHRGRDGERKVTRPFFVCLCACICSQTILQPFLR